jgi:hypothetical protein
VAWGYRFTETALKELGKLDGRAQNEIMVFGRTDSHARES